MQHMENEWKKWCTVPQKNSIYRIRWHRKEKERKKTTCECLWSHFIWMNDLIVSSNSWNEELREKKNTLALHCVFLNGRLINDKIKKKYNLNYSSNGMCVERQSRESSTHSQSTITRIHLSHCERLKWVSMKIAGGFLLQQARFFFFFDVVSCSFVHCSCWTQTFV